MNKSGEVTLVVKFDSHVWENLDDNQRQAWVDDLVNAASSEGYVSDITIR